MPLLTFAEFIPTIKYLTELISSSSSEPQCFITIIVGEGEKAQSFTLHRDVISRQTQFFNTANEGKLKEEKVYLKDVNPPCADSSFSGCIAALFLNEKSEERKKILSIRHRHN